MHTILCGTMATVFLSCGTVKRLGRSARVALTVLGLCWACAAGLFWYWEFEVAADVRKQETLYQETLKGGLDAELPRTLLDDAETIRR